ncbi:hypothetical protein TVAG_443570 [Trichomonas vaginalis G3]|uniref:Leucine Rich Repeat family protein n=1 Tax=Trichomonas vaginalis (strain ATCC PRA-98 / G3) TaxID=412133 RepID=A2ETY1_TRIV3|nr:ribonuclease inhibitor domain-containing protein [Trichomonas vaginalis G3]EAY03869.1 hypothetical protein TVAG_443570 [Trichomonas vaginalis G3]KAI5552962.1 ribonuclease inhibitor domain-containing protein [Trichomonas vaginalis G3]|eukprot:XP_001316092.1 hypothetical protein [Trichomonas vaginalis G3]
MHQESQFLRQDIAKQKVQLSRTGSLIFKDMQIPTIDIGVQKSLIILEVSDTDLKSFETLKPQPSLKEICVTNCPISNFRGLGQQTKLSTINFVNTPISEQKFFRLACLVAVGPKLSSINNVAVTRTERLKAECYPPITKKLLDEGWILQYPIPSKEDFKFAAQKFNINYEESELEVNKYDNISASPIANRNKKSKQPENNQSFVEKAAEVLLPLGFHIRSGENMIDDVLESVDTLVQLAASAEKAADEAEEEEEEEAKENKSQQ